MEDILNAVANVGFPIAIAVYLLVRVEKVIGELKDEISKLSEVIKAK